MVSRRDGSLRPQRRGQRRSSNASISTDGAVVAFQSSASNLVAGDSNSSDDVFIRTRASALTRDQPATRRQRRLAATRRSAATATRSRSPPRRRTSSPPTPTRAEDVYVRQFTPSIMRLASRANGAAGAKGNNPSSQPSISDDGKLDRLHLGRHQPRSRATRTRRRTCSCAPRVRREPDHGVVSRPVDRRRVGWALDEPVDRAQPEQHHER